MVLTVGKIQKTMSYQQLSEKQSVARKQHRCIWCPEPIMPKETLIRACGIYDGDFQSDVFHPECWEAKNRYFQMGQDDDSFMPHEFKRGSHEQP